MNSTNDKGLTRAGLVGASLAMALMLAPITISQARADVATQTIEVTGEVAVVNKEKRSLTLIDGTGKARNISVPEEAKGFDDIKRGDQMTIAYMESVEIFLSDPGTEAGVEEMGAQESAEKGDMPGGMVARAIQVNAKVTAVDKEKGLVTVTGEDGEQMQGEFGPGAEELDKIKVGDTISVRVSRVLVVETERPDKK